VCLGDGEIEGLWNGEQDDEGSEVGRHDLAWLWASLFSTR